MLLFGAWPAYAAIIPATSCSRTHVGEAVTAAVAGDRVTIPAGTCSWTSTLTVAKEISIEGAGIDVTILEDNVSRLAPSTGTMITLTPPAGAIGVRLTGMTLKNGTEATKHFKGVVVVGGSSKLWRIDRVKFKDLVVGNNIHIYDDTYGVIDHCVFELAGSQGVVVKHNSWGGVGDYGDKSWNDASYLGTEKAIYIEDNTFTNTSVFQTVDAFSGGRFVFRYNTVTNMYIGNHGTESSNRLRSGRMFEIYNNTFTKTGTAHFTGVFLRGGTGVIHNNTFTGYNAAVTVTNFRSTGSYSPWGQCTGSNAWDQNSLSNGYACLDQVGRAGGDLLSSFTPTPVAWPNQALEPVYEWNNTRNGGDGNIGSDNPTVIASGRDFFNDTVMPGYTAYTYPHPLTTGGAPPPASWTMTTTIVGTGTITSSPTGIACPGDCVEVYQDGSSVTLTGVAGSGFIFTGWSGSGCSGVGTCVVAMTATRAVTATFTAEGGGATTTRATSVTTPAATSHVISLPTSIVAGNLLLAFFSTSNSNVTVTWPGTWTRVKSNSNGTSVRHEAAYRKADGAEGASVTVTTDVAVTSAHVSAKISDVFDPAVRPPVFTLSTTGTSIAADPQTATPTSGAQLRTWFAVAAVGGAAVTATPPTNYANQQTSSNAAGPTTLVADRSLNALSEDPGPFALSASQPWLAYTVAVDPASPEPPAAPVLNTVTGTIENGASVVISGDGFGATQGTGGVVITDASTWPGGTVVGQTETAWAAGSITVTLVQGGFSTLANKFLYVTTDAGTTNPVGFVLVLTARGGRPGVTSRPAVTTQPAIP
jgi:hypothetical protein